MALDICKQHCGLIKVALHSIPNDPSSIDHFYGVGVSKSAGK